LIALPLLELALVLVRFNQIAPGSARKCSGAGCPGHDPAIADNLSKAGWTWGCVATVDRDGRTIFVTDAHRDDGKRFVVRADEKLTAFVAL
jgi:hypothetical protein